MLIKEMYVLSNSYCSSISNFCFLKNKINGSKNKSKHYNHIARIHQKIRNKRVNWLHHISRDLVNRYDVICVENLKIRELLEKKQLSRSIAEVKSTLQRLNPVENEELYQKTFTKLVAMEAARRTQRELATGLPAQPGSDFHSAHCPNRRSAAPQPPS